MEKLSWFKSQDTNAHIIDTNSLSCLCNLDPEKQSSYNNMGHITKITKICKSKKNEKIPYYLDEHGITYRKIRDGPNVFHAILVPNALQPFISYKSHSPLGHNDSTRLYHFIRRHYY